MEEAAETAASAVVEVMNLEVAVGARVRMLRELRGWSQAQLADRLRSMGFDMHQTTVAKLEGANRPIRVNELAALAVIFDSTVHELLRVEGIRDVEVAWAAWAQFKAADEELGQAQDAAARAKEAVVRALARREDAQRRLGEIARAGEQEEVAEEARRIEAARQILRKQGKDPEEYLAKVRDVGADDDGPTKVFEGASDDEAWDAAVAEARARNAERRRADGEHQEAP